MKRIFSFFGIVFDALAIPISLLLAIFLPFMCLSTGNQVISNGVSFADADDIDVAVCLFFIVYLTLRFKSTRKVYFAFPALFEVLKMFIIAGLFTSVAETFVNWAFEESTDFRRTLGVVIYISVIVIWRIFVSIYYTKKPIVPFLEKKQEQLKNISETNEQG